MSWRKLAERRGDELEEEAVLELAAEDCEEMELAEELEKEPTEFVSCLKVEKWLVRFKGCARLGVGMQCVDRKRVWADIT